MAYVPTTQFTTVDAGFKWSQDAANKALEKRKFIYVGGKQASKRALTGATRAWNAKPAENATAEEIQAVNDANRAVFVLEPYRIAGTPENIRAALGAAGVAEASIAQALASAITRDNYKTTKYAAAAAERAAHDALESEKKGQVQYTLQDIVYFGQNLDKVVVHDKSGNQRGSLGTGGGKRSESLAAKVLALKDLRAKQPGVVVDVYDVSDIDGKGAKARKIAQPKSKTATKFGDLDVLPIVSNNIDSYILALTLIDPEAQTKYASSIAKVRAAIAGRQAGVGKVAVAPSAKIPSPRAAPGATLPGATLAAPPVLARSSVASPRMAAPSTIGAGATGLPSIPVLRG